MQRSWPILILGLALAGSLFWGYTQNRDRARLAIRAENSYQQSFHRLNAMVVSLEDAMARILATTDPGVQRTLLNDIRVFSATAAESISGLPLLNVPLERTDFFMNQLRNLAEEYGYILNHGGNLTPSQWAHLRQMYEQSKIFKTEMGQLSPTVAHGNIRWFQTERATHYSADGTQQTPFMQAVARLDGQLAPAGAEGAEAVTGPLPRPKGDLGPAVGLEQALRKVTQFLDMGTQEPPRLAQKTEGPFPLYIISAVKKNNVPVTVGVSVNGGHVIWMLDGREVKDPVLSQDQAMERARQFVAKNGLTGMKEQFYDAYGDAGAVAVVTLVPERNGLTYFNEAVKVRLARDDGEILGYDATQYWVNRNDRPPEQPRLTPEEAAARVNPQLEVAGVELGVLDIFRGQEALVYRVKAKLDGNEFDVFINAVTGQEERVERVEQPGGLNRAK